MTPLGARPVLTLVTDGARLARGRPPGERAACLLAQTRSAIAAGVDLVQLREPDLEAGELCAVTRTAVAAAVGSATRIVVNDRLDVAIAAGAAGVHLRADSLPPRAARALAPPGFLIGRSVHGIDEARAVEADVDYLIAGTVFRTRSKPGAPLLGPEGLAAIAASVGVPVLAIGGITVDRVAAVAGAGAAGLAAIGLFMSGRGGRAGPIGASALNEVCTAVRMRFDTARPPS